jgi:uncharacterized membrane protein YidH (DUF202 family)
MTDVDAEVWGAEVRTELAWSRSGIALMTCVLLLARRLTSIFHSGRAQVLGLALVVALGSTVGLLAIVWRDRFRADRPARFRHLAIGTTLLAAIGLVVALFPLPA